VELLLEDLLLLLDDPEELLDDVEPLSASSSSSSSPDRDVNGSFPAADSRRGSNDIISF